MSDSEPPSPGSRILGGLPPLGGLRPLVGPPAAVVLGADPADGAASARAEADVVRAVRAGSQPAVDPAVASLTRRALPLFFRTRGEESVRVWRDQPELLTELQVGSWFGAGWRSRALRRAALGLRPPLSLLPGRVAADVAFWRGARAEATGEEWSRLTASYVVLCYHRLSGEALPGQERMDVAPSALRAQLRLLRLAGWRPLGAGELVAFHRGGPSPGRRRYVVTADDGFVEAVRELTARGEQHPQLFAVTGAVGGAADWLADEPVADWDSLRSLAAAGGTVGSHARRHVRLDGLEEHEISAELEGSRADLVRHLGEPAVATLAYPHGAHDLRVREAARRAGYALAFTTRQGRNGAGTDPWCLRRVEPKIWDGLTSFAWKVATGESPPARWERRLERRWRERRASGAGRPGDAQP